jgi:uncharacterized protein YndB with AHSA1/START domain
VRVDVIEQTGDQTVVEINRHAPVVSEGEIAIAASPESVWEVLTAFERWPAWNPDVKSMSLNGPVAPGSTFRWKAGPGTITSEIQLVEPPRRIVWTGHTLGIRAIATWRLERREGATLARVAESFEGILPRALRRLLQSTLDRSLADGLRHLRIEAERVAPQVR